jgi:hypothetical protein
MSEKWRDRARAEIRSLKEFWIRKHGWSPLVRNGEAEALEGPIDLYVHLIRNRRSFVLKLRYEQDFETAGRREAFVNPEDLDVTGIEFWPHDVNAIKAGHTPPAICLEGTWGFHSALHKERDGRLANLNKLLLELQQCMTSN